MGGTPVKRQPEQGGLFGNNGSLQMKTPPSSKPRSAQKILWWSPRGDLQAERQLFSENSVRTVRILRDSRWLLLGDRFSLCLMDTSSGHPIRWWVSREIHPQRWSAGPEGHVLRRISYVASSVGVMRMQRVQQRCTCRLGSGEAPWAWRCCYRTPRT